MINFSEIKSRNDFADALQIPRSVLTHVLYIAKPESFYESFTIPKKNGEDRIIMAPKGTLKSIQTKLSHQLVEYRFAVRQKELEKSNISHGFERERSIVTNAQIHRNKRYVLNFDLKDFFDSFHFGRVVGFFEKNKHFLLPYEVAVVIAQLTCFNGRLPQGAPTSPVITNLICEILDYRVVKIARRYKLDYTRYADDLTFSTNFSRFLDEYDSFLKELLQEISNSGFTINQSKTRLLYRDSRQEVTGLVVNKKIGVNREYVKSTRAMAQALYSTGEFTINGIPGTIKQLEGRFGFIDQLDHYNNVIDDTKHDAYSLNGREKQFQEFLFFKTFFFNEYPLVITEGKTDIRYLKAALKSLYQKYPELICKDDDGTFRFKISFFRRSKRWKYFFGISMDGADAMKLLYRFFTGQKGVKNYYRLFTEKYKSVQKNPVIMLFDNEMESKRPLNTFLNEEVRIPISEREVLKEQLYYQLIPGSKTFLMTHPLPTGKTEAEIEDLFPPEVLGIKLGGKEFSKKDKFDANKFYGKEIFSSFVYEHYESIDFSEFVPLLDKISMLIKKDKETVEI